MKLKNFSASATPVWRSFALSLLASLASVPMGASATTIAYAVESWFGFEYLRLDFTNPPDRLGPTNILPAAGAFVGDDFSKEYFVDAAIGRLYSLDVLAPYPSQIGILDTLGNTPLGMHWDPTRDRMFVIATDASCTTSTLYDIDVSDASATEVGSTPGCIVSLAIDGDGHAFGIDQTEDALVSIDPDTGAATAIGPLGFRTTSLIGGFDFDPSNGQLYLFARDDDARTFGRYSVDTTQGHATLLTSHPAVLALAFAKLPESIMSNGFDPE